MFGVSKEDVHSVRNDQLLALIDIGLGGRAAEDLLFDGVSDSSAPNWQSHNMKFINMKSEAYKITICLAAEEISYFLAFFYRLQM